MAADEKSKGVALLLSMFLGIFGADKFYVGSIGLGVIILILTIIVIGSPISFFYGQVLSSLTLLLTILFGIGTFWYPQVNWGPTTQFDKIVAWVIVLSLIIAAFGSKSAYERYKLKQKEKYKNKKN